MHLTEYKKGGEAHIVLQEISEVIVIKEDENKGNKGNEDDEDQGIKQGSLQLLSSGIGGVFEVNEIGGRTDGSGRERVGIGEG
ncbi:hypothetical protein V6N12_046652, partial [Hibiscus sabdariffa]